MRRLSIGLAATMALLMTAAAFAQQSGTSPDSGPGPRQFYFHHPMFHGGAIVLAFVVLFALIGFFAVIGFIVRVSTRGARWRRGPVGRGPWGVAGSALTILEERFARGEIDKAEFEDKRKLLRP